QDAVTLEALAELWRREREASRARFAEEQRATTIVERVARGVAVRNLSFDDAAAAPGGRARVWLAPRVPSELEGVRLGPGDPVRLWREGRELPATLGRIAAGRVAVVVDDPEPLEEGRWHLDRVQPEATFDRGDRAIARFATDPALASLKAVLFDEQEPRF